MASDDARVITEVKPPFRITHVNAAWEELCGYARKEVIGRAGFALLEVCHVSGCDADIMFRQCHAFAKAYHLHVRPH